jgi:hypothetical protein
MRPKLLETHACQGGATAGYIRAGWDVTVVDIDARHAKYNPAELVIADAATCLCGSPAVDLVTLGWVPDEGEKSVAVCVTCKREMQAERDWSRSA